MTEMKHVYGFVRGVDPRDDAVRVKEKLPKFPFQVLTLPCEWAAPRKTLQRIDLPVQRSKPLGRIQGRPIVNVFESLSDSGLRLGP